MAPRTSRRALLRAASAGIAAGLAGCGSTGAGADDPYGFAVHNRLTARDFERTAELSSPEPVVVHLTVMEIGPDVDDAIFEETVEVPADSSTTVADAFELSTEGPTYAVDARFDPLVEGGLSQPRHRRDGLTVAPDESGAPTANPIPVVIQHADWASGDRLLPIIELHENPV